MPFVLAMAWRESRASLRRMALLAVEFFQHAHDLAAGLGVEVAGGLVGDQDPGVVHQRPRDGDALALAAGELVGAVLEAVVHAELAEHLRRPLAQLAPLGPEVPPRVLDHRREQGVLHDVQFRQQVVELEDEPELRVAHPASAGRADLEEVQLLVLDAPLVRRVQRAQDVQQRALPRARPALDRHELAVVKRHLHALEHVDRAVAHAERFLHVAGAKDGHGRLGGGRNGLLGSLGHLLRAACYVPLRAACYVLRAACCGRRLLTQHAALFIPNEAPLQDASSPPGRPGPAHPAPTPGSRLR